jgi:hypothetical protein
MQRIKSHKFVVHLVAFFLMTLPCIGLYFSAEAGQHASSDILIGMIVIGNGLVLFT